mmetsp:Transcript_74638/g.141340  ORF Transcript_74638/g.141340 Transcript_74638/m.141340 type:complete len:495 (+) Transcript_74638:76-1560(+)
MVTTRKSVTKTPQGASKKQKTNETSVPEGQALTVAAAMAIVDGAAAQVGPAGTATTEAGEDTNVDAGGADATIGSTEVGAEEREESTGTPAEEKEQAPTEEVIVPRKAFSRFSVHECGLLIPVSKHDGGSATLPDGSIIPVPPPLRNKPLVFFAKEEDLVRNTGGGELRKVFYGDAKVDALVAALEGTLARLSPAEFKKIGENVDEFWEATMALKVLSEEVAARFEHMSGKRNPDETLEGALTALYAMLVVVSPSALGTFASAAELLGAVKAVRRAARAVGEENAQIARQEVKNRAEFSQRQLESALAVISRTTAGNSQGGGGGEGSGGSGGNAAAEIFTSRHSDLVKTVLDQDHTLQVGLLTAPTRAALQHALDSATQGKPHHVGTTIIDKIIRLMLSCGTRIKWPGVAALLIGRVKEGDSPLLEFGRSLTGNPNAQFGSVLMSGTRQVVRVLGNLCPFETLTGFLSGADVVETYISQRIPIFEVDQEEIVRL